ncbi:MAG: PAS domain S-box protein [candidate division KSB1 bacterium]|nr:PAS domain S-box protein [candidate division KSB1 bacterium]
MPSRMNLLYNAFQHSTDGLVITDLRANIIEVNRAFLDMFGYRYEEVIGQNTRILRSPNTSTALYQEMWKAINTTGQWKGEILNRRKDGTEILNYLSITPIYERGMKVGYMGVEIDITEKKRTEEALLREKKFSESLLENANSLVVGLDLNGNIIIFNRQIQKITGYTKEEVLGKNWMEMFLPPKIRPAVEEIFRNIATGRLPSTFENSILTKSGEERLISWNNTIIRNEKQEIVGALGLGLDITESRRLQGQLLQAERLAIIGKMAAKVAHEIRNPLSSISLNAELLQDELQNLPPQEIDEAKSILDSIIAEVDRVTNLTEEYLQFSRLPETRFQTDDLGAWLEDLAASIEPELSARGVQLICDFSPNLPQMFFDPHQMRRAMLNLVRNAVEAMPRGGTVTISAKSTSRQIEIAVADTGPGIPAEVMGRIFEPFYTTKDMGTGLGLALTQQIVNEHGGTIHCESPIFMHKEGGGEVGMRGGASFIIRLPVNHAHITMGEN